MDVWMYHLLNVHYYHLSGLKEKRFELTRQVSSLL